MRCIDFGSEKELSDLPDFVIRTKKDYWSESEAKNFGFVLGFDPRRPVIAFTNADTLVTMHTLERTCEVIQDHSRFVVQGLRWEIPRYATTSILAGELDPAAPADLKLIENLSVPHAYPHNPTGEWQVADFDTVHAISGFDQRMTGPGAQGYGGMDTDFHDRAGCMAEMNGGIAMVSRKIPILHLHHYAARPLSANHDRRRMNLEVFAHLGTAEALDWTKQEERPSEVAPR